MNAREGGGWREGFAFLHTNELMKVWTYVFFVWDGLDLMTETFWCETSAWYSQVKIRECKLIKNEAKIPWVYDFNAKLETSQ